LVAVAGCQRADSQAFVDLVVAVVTVVVVVLELLVEVVVVVVTGASAIH
jgi:hypothetical protein